MSACFLAFMCFTGVLSDDYKCFININTAHKIFTFDKNYTSIGGSIVHHPLDVVMLKIKNECK